MSAHPPVTLLKSAIARMGGLEKYTWKIAEAFHKKGAPVTLLTTGPLLPAPPGITLVSFPFQHSFSVLNVQAFDTACAHYLKAHPTPIVFGLDRNRFQTHIRAGNGSHYSYLQRRAETEGPLKALSFRLNPLHRLLLSIEKTSFEHPELQVLFANSHMVRDEILNHYAIDPKKVRVAHNGVEWNAMQGDFDCWEESQASIAAKFGLDRSAHHLLFIGHNYERKGLDILLKALSLLKNKEIHLSIVGKDKRVGFYQHLASSLNLTDQVHFFGPQSEIRPFYQMADTLVIPSHYDPFANVTVEALAMGLFVVSSKTNGGSEVLTEQTGAVIPSLMDPEAVAEVLNRAVKNKKTKESASAIRNAVRYLDFETTLNEMIIKISEKKLVTEQKKYS